MPQADAAAKKRALAGVQAVFERYHKLAADVPKRNGEPNVCSLPAVANWSADAQSSP